MRRHRGRTLLGALIAATTLIMLRTGVASAATSEVWLADLSVDLAATLNVAAGRISHIITVKNLGDDSGRSLVIYHQPVVGTQVLTVTPTSATCETFWFADAGPGVNVVRCTMPMLNPGQVEVIKVLTTSATTWPGRKITTAQVMGATPDYNGANNTDLVEFP